ncbi:hypothetical protein [Streptomyces sp. H34-S4]|uniref:hypothetical protein n=1 Tax=Streptomyces sp. H34-S4 TaxID=2996463 RepID=UPI00226EE333|nr:hypothetical protein [Streptomyces sp. H34-S4]MCY0937629.1 hypothetical protein [Streptomyces sp. H34-S4]
MTLTATLPAATLVPEQPATGHARRLIGDLLLDLRLGAWTPTTLEQRVAGILTVSAAGAGTLTSGHVRRALWEGTLTMTQENGARFATVLAHLVPLLDDPELSAPDVAAAAVELLAAVDHG